ncbi:MAG TPA: hypothetical protein VLH56_18185 [Dissulfurispiraceae bacterium]|nr:hypothetical protein [Dissulfurispiraceae bacterium]
MFKETIEHIETDLDRIDADLQLFEMPQHPNARQPMASKEELGEMRQQLLSIHKGCMQYMTRFGFMYKGDYDLYKEERKYNRGHLMVILALLIVQLVVLSLTLIISGNRENSPNGSDNGKKEDISLVIDISDVINPLHSELEPEQGIVGLRKVFGNNINKPHLFQCVHTVMHPVHVFLIIPVAYNRHFMGIEPVKRKHEFARIGNIPS